VPRKDFPPEIKLKCLLWSDRHCCLCEKNCDTDIEIAHIIENDNVDMDNAIPLCFDCHSKIGKYNPKHPLGTKYKEAELKTRREQVYEKYTKHLVPPINIELIKNYPTENLNIIKEVSY
jgi:5-methylcytosine-specific restriction endonuclease McrA